MAVQFQSLFTLRARSYGVVLVGTEVPDDASADDRERQVVLVEADFGQQRFVDVLQTGRIPPEILENEELMEKLPVLFRTLRGQKVPDEQLDELVRKIRKVRG
jgi:hypothetical protein